MSTANQAVAVARQHQLAGRLDQAKAALRRLLQSDPGRPEANHLMALVLMDANELDQAEFFARRAATARPTDAEIRNSLGLVLTRRGKLDDAAAAFAESARLAPTYLPPLLCGGNLHMEAGRYDEAEACYRQAAAIVGGAGGAGDTSIAANWSMLMLKTGRADEAAALLRPVVAANPADADLIGRLAYVLNYVWGADPRESYEVHAAYGRALAAAVPAMPPLPPPTPADAERKLRIAFISPDLREHSVSFFLEPILEHHDRAAFEITLYSTLGKPDAVSRRLASRVSSWCDAATLDDARLAQRVRADRIDVLIDLSGHTANGRLAFMARRAAPVQATFLGYPNTTGVAAIDARIVDQITDPPTEADARCVERLVRLPAGGCFICFRPPEPAEDPGLPEPRADAGPVTFGSFNQLPKIGPRLVALWSRVLQAVPGSRLVLKSFNLTPGTVRDRLLSRFAEHGIAPDRIELLGGVPDRRGHLAAYGRIDVALDTFPYHGTTTTCEAMWMGVPVVVREGDVHASRVGISLLRTVGLPELITRDDDEYVRVAVALAGDAPRRAAMRRELRTRMAASPLCDGPAYTRRFEAVLRDLWRAHAAKGGR